MSEDRNTKKEERRISLTLSGEAYETVHSLASRRSKTVAGVIRDAIALENWARDTIEKGDKILVERDGKLHEVLIR
ncbi:MAG: hypothetical protein IT350_11260 [Deltaproteobacteria bacterium]|nr:hypothetical protein [Deltaproteobacteria bacterium]